MQAREHNGGHFVRISSGSAKRACRLFPKENLTSCSCCESLVLCCTSSEIPISLRRSRINMWQVFKYLLSCMWQLITNSPHTLYKLKPCMLKSNVSGPPKFFSVNIWACPTCGSWLCPCRFNWPRLYRMRSSNTLFVHVACMGTGPVKHVRGKLDPHLFTNSFWSYMLTNDLFNLYDSA